MKKYCALVAHAVRSTFMRVLKQADASLVDDAIQAVWLSLCADGCRRLKGFESKAALSTWLTVLSTRRALDYIRSEMRKGSMRHVHLDDEDRDIVKELQTPETEEQPGARAGRKMQFAAWDLQRSEEHTSELQSQSNLVCRLLLEKKKKEAKNKQA